MTRAARDISLDAIDWPELIAPGDLVVWGQASAEPTSLTVALMAQRAAIGGFRAFIGVSWSDSVDPAHGDHVAFSSYCGTARNRQLGRHLDILPLPYDALAATLARDRPVALIAVAPGDDEDHFSFGAAGDYVADLLQHARLVVAELSTAVPRTLGSMRLRRDRVDLVVRTDAEPPAPPPARWSAIDGAVAERVAALIEDGSTLQVGLGGIPAAVLDALCGHRDLGVHSGLIGDEIARLAEQGVLTNARKTVDRGMSVAGLLAGGPVLMAWAHDNPTLAIRSTAFTHDPAVLRSLERFVAINSAIEVDLTGQTNAEIAGGRYVGAVGGASVFLRGARESRGGLPIVALPSAAGSTSRIVARLSGPVSTARADAGIVVTEHGVADLRGLSLRARRERMLAVAHPDHRPSLEAQLVSGAQE